MSLRSKDKKRYGIFAYSRDEVSEIFTAIYKMSEWLKTFGTETMQYDENGDKFFVYNWDIPLTDVHIVLSYQPYLPSDINYFYVIRDGHLTQSVCWVFADETHVRFIESTEDVANIEHAFKCWCLMKARRIKELNV